MSPFISNINPKKFFELTPEEEKELERKLKKIGKEWERIQEEWEYFKNYWWKGFFVITSILFFSAIIRNGSWIELYIWFFALLVFTIVALYTYAKRSKEIKQIEKLGIFRNK